MSIARPWSGIVITSNKQISTDFEPLDAHFVPAHLDPVDSIVTDALVRSIRRLFLFVGSHHANRVAPLATNSQSLIHLNKFLVERLFLVCSCFRSGHVRCCQCKGTTPHDLRRLDTPLRVQLTYRILIVMMTVLGLNCHPLHSP